MKSTIQKSLYTLFLASYIFSASCFANENETPKENNETTSSSSQKKEEKSNPKIDTSKKQSPQTINKKIFLFLSVPAAIAFYMLFTSNNNGGSQIPPSNNSEGSKTPQKKPIDYNDEHVKEIETLLKSGMNVDEYDDKHKTLLYKHLEAGHKEAVRYLVEEKGADVNRTLRLACKFCQKDMVESLLKNHGADATKTYIYHQNATFLQIICDAKLNKNQRQDAVETVKLLIQHGTKVDATTSSLGETALAEACQRCYYDLAEELINQGADVKVKRGLEKDNILIDTCSSIPYHLSGNNIEDFKKTIQLLLKHLDINDTNDDNVTALHMACLHENKEAVEYLINQGAKLNAVTNSGNLPIHYACRSSKPSADIVKLLIEKNEKAQKAEQFDLQKKNTKGETPLYMAASQHSQIRSNLKAFDEIMKDLTKKFSMTHIINKNRLNDFSDIYGVTHRINLYSKGS